MAEEEEIRIGYLTTLYHTSFILKGSGLIENDLGLKTSWKLYPNGPAMIEAFLKDAIDIGYVGLPPAMIGIDRGIKIKCIAGGHVEGTVLIGRKDFHASAAAKDALAQFRGRSIGTPRKGTIHDVILRKLISDSGLTGEVKIKNYDWADFILDAMIDGEVDGGCGTPPLAVLASRQIDAKIVLPPRLMWPYNPSYGIVATEKMLKGFASFLEGFLKLHENACNLIREKPEEAAKIIHDEMNFIEEDFAEQVFRVSPKYCASLPREYIESTMAFVPTLMNMGYLTRQLKMEEVFFTRAIEKVHTAGHHYDDPGMLR